MLKSKLLQSFIKQIQKSRFGSFLRVLLCFSLLVSAVGTSTASWWWPKEYDECMENFVGNDNDKVKESWKKHRDEQKDKSAQEVCKNVINEMAEKCIQDMPRINTDNESNATALNVNEQKAVKEIYHYENLQIKGFPSRCSAAISHEESMPEAVRTAYHIEYDILMNEGSTFSRETSLPLAKDIQRTYHNGLLPLYKKPESDLNNQAIKDKWTELHSLAHSQHITKQIPKEEAKKIEKEEREKARKELRERIKKAETERVRKEAEEEEKKKAEEEEKKKLKKEEEERRKEAETERIAKEKAAAEEIETSGYLANAIRSGGSENDSKEIFARIDSRTGKGKSGVWGAWGQARGARTKYSGDGKSLGDYIDNEKGGFIGCDMYIAQEALPGKLILGAYTKVNEHSISQGDVGKGNIINAGLGMYGSYEEEKWEAKAIVSGSYDRYYNNERKIKMQILGSNKILEARDFAGGGIGCNLEGALKVRLSDAFDLRPYLGLDTRRSYYDSIEEKSLDKELEVKTEAGYYDRVFAKAGLVVRQKTGKFGWNVNAEYKRLLSGNFLEIVSVRTYKREKIMDSIDSGIEEGKDVLGAGVGGSYSITENILIFANVDILTSKKYGNQKVNLGASYRFWQILKQR